MLESSKPALPKSKKRASFLEYMRDKLRKEVGFVGGIRHIGRNGGAFHFYVHTYSEK